MSQNEPRTDDAQTRIIGECDECGDDVPASDSYRANGYDAVFCSAKCRHAWKSGLDRRVA